MIEIGKAQLEELLAVPKLVENLYIAFQQKDITVPIRHHHDYANPGEGIDSTLLLMPAWEDGSFLGVKLITVSPNNSRYNLPSIHGIYILFDGHTGKPLAQLDAQTLTNCRTAAASALASRFLSRKDSSSLLMIGTGALAPYLIKAHAAVRPVKQVFIWGRNYSKAENLCKNLVNDSYLIQAVKNIEDVIGRVDIITAATLSEKPLIRGKWLKPGQHIDLVGSFKPNMREADNETIRRASVYTDILETAPKESGDLLIPLKDGV